MIVLLLISALTGGCLRTEPEELPPLPASPRTLITPVPVVSPGLTVTISRPQQPVAITIPKQSRIFRDLRFSADVEKAVSDFSDGRTADTINGFLRWESVRARTNQSESASIREQISRIDYALFNTTAKETISLYVGISGEQLKRVRNDSVYEEKGYTVASYDPSVIYYRLTDRGRDSEGYVTMCVIESRRGDYLLYVNTTDREFLLPRGTIRDVLYEEEFAILKFSAESVPKYRDLALEKTRLIYTTEHP
jgi:hypothetical protein